MKLCDFGEVNWEDYFFGGFLKLVNWFWEGKSLGKLVLRLIVARLLWRWKVLWWEIGFRLFFCLYKFG